MITNGFVAGLLWIGGAALMQHTQGTKTMKTYIHVVTGWRVMAMDDETCWNIIKQYYPDSLQYQWRDVTNHPAAQASYQVAGDLT